MNRRIRRPPGADIQLRMRAESDAANAALERQGLHLPERPLMDAPGLPEDITGLDDASLMYLFTQLNVWASYCAGQLACAQIDERATQRTLDYAEATALLTGWKGGSDARVAVAKATVATDDEVRALRMTLDEDHAYRKLIEVLSANLERDVALVSREITRRSAAEPRRSRSERWST